MAFVYVGLGLGVPVAVLIAWIISATRQSQEQREALLREYKLARESFARFKELNPAHWKDGRVSCPNCAGTKIFVRRLHRDEDRNVLNGHICSQCGIELYRSVT